jgi:hypothetical protein
LASLLKGLQMSFVIINQSLPILQFQHPPWRRSTTQSRITVFVKQ